MRTNSDAKSIRRSITFSPKAANRLTRLREDTDASNDTEVVRNALRLYEWVIEQTKEGNEVYLRNGKGMEQRVPVFEMA